MHENSNANSHCAFHSLAPSNQSSKNKIMSAIPLIFQAPMWSPKEFPSSLWTFNSFSNDLLAAWPPNAHTSTHVLPLWGSVPLLTTETLVWLTIPILREHASRQNFQLWKDHNENNSKEQANTLCFSHQHLQRENPPLRLSQIACTLFKLNYVILIRINTSWGPFRWLFLKFTLVSQTL